MRQLDELTSLRAGAPAPPRPENAVRQIEDGSINWMGLGRVVWAWWALFFGPAEERARAMAPLLAWFRRQGELGHMTLPTASEQCTASHWELYGAIVAAARLLALLRGAEELREETGLWLRRQTALAEIAWVRGPGWETGHALLPHARAGHGGISQDQVQQL
jgi:hypothetical protein